VFVLEVPVTNGKENEPYGDPTHVNYRCPSYWISKAWEAGWNCDLRDSQYYIENNFRNAVLVFRKNELPDGW
jgi:hypothetical protein